IADDAVEDAAHVDEIDVETALLADLATHGLACRLSELDEAAGDAPLARQRHAATLDEQDAVAVEDHRAHADARRVGIFAAHTRPASHASVAYLSRASASTAAASPGASPSARSSRP